MMTEWCAPGQGATRKDLLLLVHEAGRQWSLKLAQGELTDKSNLAIKRLPGAKFEDYDYRRIEVVEFKNEST